MEQVKDKKNLAVLLAVTVAWYSTIAFGVGASTILLPLGPGLVFWNLFYLKEKRKRFGYSFVAAFGVALCTLFIQEVFHSGSMYGMLIGLAWHTVPLVVAIKLVGNWQKTSTPTWKKCIGFLSLAAIVATICEQIFVAEVMHSAKLSQEFPGLVRADGWRVSILSRVTVMPLANLIYWGTAFWLSKPLPEQKTNTLDNEIQKAA